MVRPYTPSHRHVEEPATLQLSSSDHPSDLLRGLWLPVTAARLIFRTPQLLRWSRIAAAVTALSLVVWLSVLFLWTDDAVAAVWPKPSGELGRMAWVLAVGVNLFLIPIAAVAGTLFYQALQALRLLPTLKDA